MKIENLIRIFEKCIPIYQKAVDEKWSFKRLWKNQLMDGICSYCYFILLLETKNVFKTYYKNFTDKRGLLFETVIDLESSIIDKEEVLKRAILPRLEFLKQQVKELKKLQKQGYTDV